MWKSLKTAFLIWQSADRKSKTRRDHNARRKHDKRYSTLSNSEIAGYETRGWVMAAVRMKKGSYYR